MDKKLSKLSENFKLELGGDKLPKLHLPCPYSDDAPWQENEQLLFDFEKHVFCCVNCGELKPSEVLNSVVERATELHKIVASFAWIFLRVEDIEESV